MDIYRDAISSQSVKPQALIDFDSLIWVTYRLKFLAPLSVLNIPPPPSQKWHIHKDNHVKVRLVAPPGAYSDEPRGQYLQPRTSLCKIPHICLGQIGSCEAKLHLLLFFPRMLHYSKKGTADSLIPYAAQQQLWNRVIIPAIAACRQPGQETSTPASVEEQYARHGRKSAKFSSIQPNNIDRFVTKMRTTIRAECDLQMFGSFFYVVDGRGFKHLTSQVVKSAARQKRDADSQEKIRKQEAHHTQQASQRYREQIERAMARQQEHYRGGAAEQPILQSYHAPATMHRLVPEQCPKLSIDDRSCWSKLTSAFPLDFDFMADRAACGGELFLDLAVSFHPPDAYVGVWKPEPLMCTFQKGGIRKPRIYYKNSLKHAGAVTGVTDESVAEQTGIIYCQAYIGAFERIRSYKKDYDFFSEIDAAQTSKAFFTEVDKLISICEDQLPSDDQPDHASDYRGRFGVRIEYRMTAASAKDLVETSLWQVSADVISLRPSYDAS